ncbi:MAG: hypothetical protein IMF10_01135 [Proteobacteria bacterium]|nr:hypothetical protein [Pseudomonadota bacterium]
MKKTLITLTIMLAAAALVAVFSCPAMAAVSGPCVDCHTMHNSQNGDPMATDLAGTPTEDTFGHLTRSSCIGCHKGPTVGGAPDVMMTYDDPDEDVSAGGSFAVWTDSTDDAKIHNVQDMYGLTITTDLQNNTASGVPGLGTDFANMNNLSGGSPDPQKLTCAGAWGCHGVINNASLTTSDAGIRGFHHGSDAYRYLKIEGAAGNDVIGKGSGDWEAGTGGATSTNHNVYSASTTVGINKLCANCHPDFHDMTDTYSGTYPGGSWIRHPTDNTFANTATNAGWDLSSVTTNYKQNPFAFTDISQATTTDAYSAQTTSAAVSCLSCHRAHGTPYADLLRFPYDGQDAGSAVSQGCLGCHYKQRG